MSKEQQQIIKYLQTIKEHLTSEGYTSFDFILDPDYPDISKKQLLDSSIRFIENGAPQFMKLSSFVS